MINNGYCTHLTEMPKTIQEECRKIATYKPISTKVVSSTPGRLRLRVAPHHRQSGDMERIANALQAQPNITQVKTNIHNGSIVIQHDTQDGSLENVLTTLKDLGIIFGDIALGKSEAAAEVSNAVVDLNKRVKKATNNSVDLRFLFPLGLGILSIRKLLAQGLQFEIIPWYVLAWYAFDSFIKLHGMTSQHSTNEIDRDG
ncbi:hypothetical protein F7734_15290 [Scytonema sp. UIC 10036]|nr:hypothetical protein [Scytonema sp. UIC 10036]